MTNRGVYDPETGEVRQDDHGREIPDSRPVRLPAGMKRPETLAEQVQRLVRTQISRQAEEQGFETFEESEDFDVDGEQEPSTPYEAFFDPVLGKDLTPEEFRRHQEEYRRQYLDAQKQYFDFNDRMEALRKGGGRRERVSQRDDPERREPPEPPAKADEK